MSPRTAAAGATPAGTAGGLTGLRERLRGRSRKPSIERIYRDHHQAIYRYCLAIVRNPADAEDALQATMAAAMRALPGDREAGSIRPWLFRVAHNESISIIRARRETPSEDPLLGEDSGSAAEELEGRERLRTLVADLQALPERQRSALVMRELSDLAYSEIGEALNCGEGAARQVVHEARTALLTRNEGRTMSCEEARELIDSGDRRRLRGRKLSAHLSACSACSEYRAGIEARERDLRALCPPLPIAAAGGILAALTSGGGAGAGAAGGAAVAGSSSAAAGLGATTTAAGGLGSAAAVKGASIAAAAVIAAGAADATGVVELPGPVDLGGGSAETRSAPGSQDAGAETGTAGESTGAAGKPGSAKAKEARAQGELASSKKGANGKGKARGKRRGAKGKPGRNGNGAGRGRGANGKGGNAGAGGVGQGNSGVSPSPGPPVSTPASPPQAGTGGGGGSSAAPSGPPPTSNAGGGGGKPVAPGPPAGTPGGGPPG